MSSAGIAVHMNAHMNAHMYSIHRAAGWYGRVWPGTPSACRPQRWTPGMDAGATVSELHQHILLQPVFERCIAISVAWTECLP